MKSATGTRRVRGFTLVETIAASVILCGSVLVVGAVGTRALSQAKLNGQYEKALAVAERQLCLIDYTGIDDFIELGVSEGVVQQGEDLFQWRAETRYEGVDNLYSVRVVVMWGEGARVREVAVEGRLEGTGKYIDQSLEGESL